MWQSWWPGCQTISPNPPVWKCYIQKPNVTINTWHKISETNLMVKEYICIPRSFLVINVCNQGKILCSSCVTNSNIHGRNTRYGSDIHQTISNVSISERFQSYGIQFGFFNSLPNYITDISCNVKQFKRLLKNFLFSNSLFR